MSVLIQVLDAKTAGLAIRNTGRVVRNGGHIVIAGHVLDDNWGSPPLVVALNLQ